MNQHLINHIDSTLERWANFVCAYMPVDIDVDTAYEEMLKCSTVNTEGMIAAFREAVKYLAPQGQYKRFSFTLPDGRTANLQARFNPTPKWPTFLIPNQNLTINPEGKFAALLDTPIRVATEWASLEYIWRELRSPKHGLSDTQLVYLMPWIRECLADFDTTMLPVETPAKERKQIDKDHAAIMRDANVPFFPRLSKGLSGVARSGRILISQFRMIEAAYGREQLVHSPITVDRAPLLVEPWVREHLDEAMDQWRQDKADRSARELEAIMMKAATKGQVRANGWVHLHD